MVAGHTHILKSIRSGDESTATAAIKEHISFAYERILHSYLGLRTDASATEPAASPPTQRLWR
jgi:DNA-binding GntR family transcriptional regulator